MTSLLCISPLDGRYHEKLNTLRPFFSEYALMHYRLRVEIRWLQALAAHPEITEISPLSDAAQIALTELLTHFSIENAARIKAIELETNHDVKALEYFLKERLMHHPELKKALEFVHFACTSEDINNLAYALALKESIQTIFAPEIAQLIAVLKNKAHAYANQPMLSRTHGQPASPTTMGKELANVVARLTRQYDQLNQVVFLGKMNGAVGNFNAHVAAYPTVNWPAFCADFVTSLGLTWNPLTTQIEPHDSIAELFHVLMRFNQIVLDLNRDIWSYISIGYFKQKVKAEEVGSSTMPHKVNPIDFENSEGNIGLSNALLDHMAHKLPVSRWQRDLSDSTVLRNMGVGLGHALLAWQATLKGLNKLELNIDALEADLDQNWEVLAEALQTVMRRYGIAHPYEKLKALTRGKKISAATMCAFVDTLDLPETVKLELKALKPRDYIGLAVELYCHT